MSSMEQDFPSATEQAFSGVLGSALRARRLELGYSLDSVAADLGMSSKQVGRYETGESPLSVARFNRIAVFMSVEPGLVLTAAQADRAENAGDTAAAEKYSTILEVLNAFLSLDHPEDRAMLAQIAKVFVRDRRKDRRACR